jgi:hypothetical protein
MGDPGRYDAYKVRKGVESIAFSALGREIGKLPRVKNPKRKTAAKKDFLKFCQTYFPTSFPLPFSADHLKVIAKIQTSVLDGGLFAVAMPRGSGKTTLCEVACTWALVYGHRSFVVLVGSDAAAAGRMLDSIKVEIETNELLHDDFPEVCYPIQKLERISKRCLGQTHNGKPTYITWSAETLTLPTVPKSPASGATVKVAGLTGAIRGLKHKTASGKSIRPDLVVIDDPQTDESSRSLSQCAYRERVLSGAVLGLAGPGKQISGIMPCTVISPGDLADRMLDASKHPEWNGERCKLLYSLPEREDLWDEYSKIRADSFRQGLGGKCATEFYRNNQVEMDRGAVAAWAERHKPDELSAIQHGMNLRLDDPTAFASEYQNAPLIETDETRKILSADQVARQLNRIPRGVAPAGSTRLTAFIDVQGDLLYWLVAAWSDDFTGSVVDYGAWPDQRRPYFTLRDARPTIAQTTGISSLEASLFAALERVAAEVIGREYPVDLGGGLRVERVLVDANWGMSTEVVYRWARQTPFAALVTPSHGKAIGASSLPMEEWVRRPGTKYGQNWVMPTPRPGRVRHLVYDVNFWKSFFHFRLSAPLGDRGGLTLFGDKPQEHRLLGEHLTAEYPVEVTGRGRTVSEWKLRPNKPDNHWLDCAVGATVAASTLGIALPGTETVPKPRQKVSWAEIQRQKRASYGR